MKYALLAMGLLFAAGTAAPAVAAELSTQWSTTNAPAATAASQLHGSQQTRDPCAPCGG